MRHYRAAFEYIIPQSRDGRVRKKREDEFFSPSHPYTLHITLPLVHTARARGVITAKWTTPRDVITPRALFICIHIILHRWRAEKKRVYIQPCTCAAENSITFPYMCAIHTSRPVHFVLLFRRDFLFFYFIKRAPWFFCALIATASCARCKLMPRFSNSRGSSHEFCFLVLSFGFAIWLQWRSIVYRKSNYTVYRVNCT